MADLVYVNIYPSMRGGVSFAVAHLSELDLVARAAVVCRSMVEVSAVAASVVAGFVVETVLVPRSVADLLLS